MDGNETRGCQPYDKNTCAVGFLKKRGGSAWVRYAIAVAAVIVCAVLVTLFVKNERISGFFASLALKGGFQNNGGGGDVETTWGTEDFDSDSDGGVASETDGKSENETEETEATETNVEESTSRDDRPYEKVVSVDMSYAERGDGYLINYSGLSVDTEGLLEMGFQNAKYSYSERPVVLILHTHTSEGYYGFDESDPLHTLTKSVVSVGEKVTYELNRRGISTVHCTVIHDGESSPYAKARETIETMMKIYPTIEYVIDLHRLDLTDGEGRQIRAISPSGVAQMRFTVSSDGRKLKDTLALALSLRKELNSDGQRLCMPIVFTNSSYNAPMSPYYLKVDVGSLGNDASEALAAGEILAEMFADILKK